MKPKKADKERGKEKARQKRSGKVDYGGEKEGSKERRGFG